MDRALFERLTKCIEHRWRELAEFVEEQHTSVGERDQSRPQLL